MIHILIPMVPLSPNVTKRRAFTPWHYAQLRNRWQHDLFYSVPLRQRGQLIAQARQGQRMRVDITVFHPRIFDDDNMAAALKPVLDALKECGYLQDDGPTFLDLVLPVKQCRSAEKKTLIKIGLAGSGTE